MLFLDILPLHPRTPDNRIHRAGSQLKNVWMSDKSWEQGIPKFEKLTLSLSHSISLYMLNNFCFHGYAQKSLSHSPDMLNNFCLIIGNVRSQLLRAREEIRSY